MQLEPNADQAHAAIWLEQGRLGRSMYGLAK
jgi:hypothetical protein